MSSRAAVPLDPAGLVREIPLKPHDLVAPLTPQRDLFVLAHIGIPRVELASWFLEIAGAVERPLRLAFEDLGRFPKRTVEAFHQCAGFPRRPDVPTRRVSNIVWSGASVADVLAAAGIAPRARYLWASGLDFGDFEGEAHRYVKDLPLDGLAAGDWLLAYEINGEPLTPKHGFPVRLVVPGYYGTNSVKWLCRLELAETRSQSVFTTVLYNDPVEDGSGATRPVWRAPPECLIVSPAHRASIEAGAVEVWGWAWGSHAIDRVEVSCDGGCTWAVAGLEPRRQWAWQRFAYRWTPWQSGRTRLLARATDVMGQTQPEKRGRNALHHVDVHI